MKTKLFDKNLYIEGLNQLKTASLICFLISIVGDILSFVSNCIMKYVAYLSGETNFNTIFSLASTESKTNFFFNSISCGVIAIYIFTPIFTFILFKFLFKRNASDFYHSLSVKRETLFFTFSLSALTISIGIVTICGLFSIITNGFILGILDYSTILPNFLNIIAGCLLMQSAITIGCSVSGKFFPALVTAAMIAFYPRIFITALLYTIKLSTPIIDPTKFDMPLGNSYNVLTGGIFNNFAEYKSVVYSVILALIYYMIAIRFFKNRESESAKKSGTAKQIKAPMRIAFCMIFCLPAIIIEYLMLTQGYSKDTNLTLIIPILILYFFAIVSYFLIELFSQGRYKNFGKIVLQLGWVVLLNVVLLGALYTSKIIIVGYTPTAQTVESVNIRCSGDWFYSYETDNTKEFFDNVYITDKNIIKNICENYNKSKPNLKENFCYLTVGFKQSFTTKYRKISLSEREYKQLVKHIDINDEYMKKITTVPKKIVSVNVYDSTLSSGNPMLAKIYETAANEIKELSEIDLFNEYFEASTKDSTIYNVVCYDDKGNKYTVPYIENIMPKTRIAFYSAVTYEVDEKTFEELEYSLSNPIVVIDYDSDEEKCYNERTVYLEENIYSIISYGFNEDKTKELFEYIKTNGRVYSQDKQLFSINYNFYRETTENNDEKAEIDTSFSLFKANTVVESNYGSGNVYFFVDDEHIKEFFIKESKTTED